MDDQSLDAPGPALLEPGTSVGSYVIVRDISAQGNRIDYLARVASDEHAPEARESYFRLIAAPAGALESVRSINLLQLRHPRLLALRDFFSESGVDYAVVDIPADTWPIASPASLTPEEALAVGVLTGEVLATLHGRGVAHGRITPASLVVAPNSVFLAGIEDAVIAHDPETQFAADANALAAAVVALAGAVDVATPVGAAIAAIGERAASGGYARVPDVLRDLQHALPDGLPRLDDDAATMAMSLRYGYATSIGMVRQQNQDAVGVLALEVVDDQPLASPGGIFLVADGMGGEAQGEVASRIAARVIVAEVARRFLGPAARACATDAPAGETPPGEAATQMHLDSIAALSEAFRAANARIRNLAKRIERPAGTTTTAIMLFGHDAIIGHIGDSRAYLLRGGELAQLTHDHSLVQKLIDLGQYRPGESEFDVPRNYLYRSLGQNDELEIDTWAITVGVGDTVLLCSDGLWDLVPPETIRDLMSSDHEPDVIARALVEHANAAGGHDNSTAVVLRLTARESI